LIHYLLNVNVSHFKADNVFVRTWLQQYFSYIVAFSYLDLYIKQFFKYTELQNFFFFTFWKYWKNLKIIFKKVQQQHSKEMIHTKHCHLLIQMCLSYFRKPIRKIVLNSKKNNIIWSLNVLFCATSCMQLFISDQ
jgi:hypothetical protein